MDLVGRDVELAEVTTRLHDRRLVTITGPGGIGKTALARVAAETTAPRFALGTVMVDLTRVDRPEAVGEAIAGQLGFADFESLRDSPGDQPVLLVMDNCEHVLDAAAEAAAALLDSCEMPSILATSRSPLDLPGESVFALGRLQTPPVDDEGDDTAAVRLFVARARDHGATLDAADGRLIAEVCRRVDGVPLALEIAAAQLRSRSLAELLDDLSERPHALSRPRFRGKSAHRSVADMVGGSLDLLDPAECATFIRLAVFAGPFTASMAHAVAGEPGGDPLVTRHQLDALVSSSLVVADTTGDVAWFRLLHPVRAVAYDRLDRAGELWAVQSRLVDHVVDLAVGVIVRTASGWDGTVLGDLLALYDNITAALRWALQHDDSDRRALVLVAVLWGVVHQAHTAEIGSIGEAALARWTDRASPNWADAAATVATCRYLLGDSAGAIHLAESTLPHTGASPFAPASLRRVMAQASRALRRLDDARELFAAGATVAAERNVHGIAMELWVDHALVIAEQGRFDDALAAVERVRVEAIERGAYINAAWALVARGSIAVLRGDVNAIDVVNEALDEARSIRYPAGVSFGLRSLATAQLQRGDLRGSAATLLELIDELLQRGGLNDLRIALETAALVLESAGRPAWPDIAATAASLPVTTVATSVDLDVYARAVGQGRVLTIRDVYVVCRRELRAVIEATDVPARPPDPAPRPWMASMVRDGDVWRIEFDGAAVTLRTSKGVEDLAALLAEPDRELSCLDLMGSVVAGGGANDEVLDATARRQYEDRVRELQREIEQADDDHDLARAERLRIEFDAIVDQLTAAVGLGGRSRRATHDAERARSAVTQRVRSTIKRIAEHHPGLGRHLRASVTTGSFCSYRPETTVDWHVQR